MKAEDVLKALEELSEEELKKFKWFLQQPETLPGLPTIKRAYLEKTQSIDIVDLMVHTFTLQKCLEVTSTILEKMSRNDLRQRLIRYENPENKMDRPVAPPRLTKQRLMKSMKNLEDRMCGKHLKPLELFCRTDQTHVCAFCVLDHKNHELVPLREESEGKKAELRKTEAEVQEMIQERRLKIQEIRESVKISKDAADREKAEGVQVFTALIESAERGLKELLKEIQDKQETTEKEAEDFIRDLEQEISELKKRSSEVKQLSQDEDHLHLLQSFSYLTDAPPVTHCVEERVHPPSYEGTVKRAVSQMKETLWADMEKRLEMKRIQQFAVDLTLDPDTAHPKLILSDDKKQVKHGNVWKNLPEYPERFSLFTNVLAEQSFTTGRFYFQVQVTGKTDWDLGVARESVERKGETDLSTENGFWTIILRNGNRYVPGDDDSVNLHLHPGPQKVGVFVDYEEGLVSFYDVDAAALIYSFTGCCFKEKLYPFFSPFLNQGGTNSAPLIICPVNQGGCC
ncbi:E3 ubiquitin-protein ligase TRIM21-like [Xiphophorus couchianus]|uniref:E3 ubiquitin-protein ligase TRIM21-like n=1 Tax=Xiphophorus couchianus TaxID=32473 RepID=UPI001016F844|nr:E3 ubiquitin-protein ligase TRIM21-like [Xiphophorus couchianus]